MSQDQMTMPQPTVEHKKLREQVGLWDVDCTFFMDPSQPPMKMKAREKTEMFGQFWTMSLFEAEMFGAPFIGRATLGYDPTTGDYVSTWIDTMSPQFFHFRGKFDASGKKLAMSGQGIDCMSNQMTEYRTTEEHHGPDNRVFEMFMKTADGHEVKMFTHVYTRA